MKESLNNLSRSAKINFLKKLASGEFKLKESFKPKPMLEFRLQDDLKYKCKQDGKILTFEEIRELRYQYSFNRILAEASGSNSLPKGIVLLPRTEDEFLDSLLDNSEISHISDAELDRRIKHLEKILVSDKD